MAATAIAGAYTAAHEIITDTLTSSPQLYPGTSREVKIYVPDAYKGTTPACLYVGLDGILCNAPHVMDSLIAAGKMPVTIGVFLQPGVITDTNGRVIRYNRSNEFDSPTPKFASFLEQEVLPFVEQHRTSAGIPVRLSGRAADRMIFGLSSGGIAAFNAAWHRPDLFSRVFSGVGTFVAMRGGNDIQAIVRKSEPRPLRICLQDGTNDIWNALFGHWYEGNRMLATALDFAGYDTRYDWSDCKHGVKRASEIFADVMEWIWTGWPEAPKAGKTQNDLLSPLLIDGSKWEEKSHATPTDRIIGKIRSEGTFAVYPDGTFCAHTHEGSNCLWQYILNGGETLHGQAFYWLHSYDNSLLIVSAMTFDGAGNLWVVTNQGIQICDQNGRVRGIIMLPDGISSVNDIIVGDGEVTLVTPTADYVRKFNSTAAVRGGTPKSQGQG